MELMEILLLVAGLAAFIISFLINDKSEDIDANSITEEEIRKLVKEEYRKSRGKLDDLTDETVNYTMEKAERQLERITSEKMLAMGEYSDTILSQINKNHQEAVFLNDMLNKNKKELSVMLSQAMQDAKEAENLANKAVINAKQASAQASSAVDTSRKAVDNSVVAEEKMLEARKLVHGDDQAKAKGTKTKAVKTKRSSKSDESDDYQIEGQIELPLDDKDFLLNSAETPAQKTTVKSSTKKVKAKETAPKVSVQFDIDSASSDNNNDKILRLYRQGKSNVAIAKELGLGVGEVNFVIDLFEGKK